MEKAHGEGATADVAAQMSVKVGDPFFQRFPWHFDHQQFVVLRQGEAISCMHGGQNKVSHFQTRAALRLAEMAPPMMLHMKDKRIVLPTCRCRRSAASISLSPTPASTPGRASGTLPVIAIPTGRSIPTIPNSGTEASPST